MQVVVEGLLTNYSIEGSGEVVLLLHGWGDTLETFNQLALKLKNDYKVLRLDLPGFGKTESPRTTYNLESYAIFLEKFLEKLSIEYLYAVVGHSNGGAIAIKALANDFITSDKLVLLASSGIRTNTSGYKKLIRISAKTAKIPTKLLPKNYQNKLRKKVYSKIGSDMFIAEDMQETFKQIVAEDLVDQSGNITAKTILIYGDKDSATPVKYGEIFHKSIKNSKLIIIPNVGHFVHIENSDLVEDLVLKFLDES